jgi:AcrR family transcriptional regulator
MSSEATRRDEILATAANLFASSGFRTTLHDISDACGILPGSLYHHFDSKEAIIVELVERYRDDLDRLAKEAVDGLFARSAPSVEDQVVAFGEAIAACGIRHRAALLLSLHEPPTVAGEDLAQLARQTPAAVDAAMLRVLETGRKAGAIRAGVDLTLLAERLVHSMLHLGVGVSHRSPGGTEIPAIRCRLLLRGIAVDMPARADLDRSAAMTEARAVVSAWDEIDDGADDDRAAQLRAIARAEFGRRGYEATTMRDIAGAAHLSTGTVYRMFESKEVLLESIMGTYVKTVTGAWSAVVRARSTPLEQLDALTWLNIAIVDRFSDEYKIQLAWIRQSPPSTVDLGATLRSQLRQLKSLLAGGARDGELQVDGPSSDIRVRAVMELLWTPETIIRAAGVRRTHAFVRDTLLRGAATKRS